MPDQTPQSPKPLQGGPKRPSLVTLHVDYSAFYAFAAQGKVSSVVIEGQDIQGTVRCAD